MRLPDKESYEIAKTILAFESAERGRRIGQTFMELVLEAADIESYPEEVQERLREIRETGKRKSVERFLASGGAGLGEE